jgi:hypothetical protein
MRRGTAPYLLHVDHHKAFNLRIFLLVEAAVCQGHGCVFALSRQTADVDYALVNFRGGFSDLEGDVILMIQLQEIYCDLLGHGEVAGDAARGSFDERQDHKLCRSLCKCLALSREEAFTHQSPSRVTVRIFEHRR